jgi:hypothetical protein
MSWWIEAMRQLGGGKVPTPYNDDFLFWRRRQVIAIDDYPYVGINYRGDPDMSFPPDSTYGDIGMKSFYIFHFSCVLQKGIKTQIFLDGIKYSQLLCYAYVGL